MQASKFDVVSCRFYACTVWCRHVRAASYIPCIMIVCKIPRCKVTGEQPEPVVLYQCAIQSGLTRQKHADACLNSNCKTFAANHYQCSVPSFSNSVSYRPCPEIQNQRCLTSIGRGHGRMKKQKQKKKTWKNPQMDGQTDNPQKYIAVSVSYPLSKCKTSDTFVLANSVQVW